MKKFLLGFFLCVSFVPNISAQKSQTQRSDQTEASLRRHIEYLASDKLEGRRTGEPGANIAANYIAKEFTSVGLRAGAKTKTGKASYLQPFPYVTGVEMAKTGNGFTLEVTQADGNRLKVENMLPLKPVGFSPNGSVDKAGVVYAGFGITSKEPKFDDYILDDKEIDVAGKVIIIFDGVPDNDNPHNPFQKFDLRTKALIAKEHGAIGMLVISREAKFDDDKLTRMGYDQALGEAAIPTFVISRNTAQNILGVNEDALKTAEKFAAAKKDPEVKSNVAFPNTNPVVSFKVNLIKKSVDAYNVIGILPGTDPKLKNEAIVIGAHYDHLGRGGSGSLAANSTEIHHGADDNASGTAAIIELARQFKSEPGAVATGFRNKRTLIFIAFSGEEEGLFGSNFYVNNPVFPLENTVAMINMDMVGRLKDRKLTIGGIGTATEWKSMVEANNPKVRTVTESTADGAIVTSGEPFPLFILQLNEDGFGPSDHSSFYGKKIPVLFFFTGTHEDYHKPSDTADKIKYGAVSSVMNYVQLIIKDLDGNPTRPTYNVAKTTMQGGRTGFNISLGTIPNYADSTDGLLLDGVREISPAAKAGVKAGDKVVKLAGHDIRNVKDYTFVLGEMKAGEEYEIVVLRAGERLTFKIVPVKR